MIAARLKQLRQALGLSAPQIAKRLNVRAQVIYDIEREKQRPRVDVIVAAHTRLGASAEWLLAGRGPMFPGDKPTDRVRSVLAMFAALVARITR